MFEITKDILDIDTGIIFTQVNCDGELDTPVTIALGDKYITYHMEYYIRFPETYHSILYGTNVKTPVSPFLKTVLCFSQLHKGDRQKQTNFDYLFRSIKKVCEENPKTIVYLPYEIVEIEEKYVLDWLKYQNFDNLVLVKNTLQN